MRALLQRVLEASVRVNGQTTGSIGRGFVILWGIGKGDAVADVDQLVEKICKLRVFEDTSGKMNLSIQEISGAILLVSQFTLFADMSKGNRPSFLEAAPPAEAIPLYNLAIEKFKAMGLETATGSFGADMKLALLNDGPVTLWLDSRA
jgi:D-aminoacyl-tRNA deacylase